MPWSTDKEYAKMLLDIPYTMNNDLNDQLALNLVDIRLYNQWGDESKAAGGGGGGEGGQPDQ